MSSLNYRLLGSRSISLLSRLWNGKQAIGGADGEQKLKNVLLHRFPLAKAIEVKDISGGCGAMFEIMVESVEFQGLNVVKQHRLVNEALKEEIKDMHGLRIHTYIPNT